MTTQRWAQQLLVPEVYTDAEAADLRAIALSEWHRSIPPGWAPQGEPVAELKVAHPGLPNTWTDPETGETVTLPNRIWRVLGDVSLLDPEARP